MLVDFFALHKPFVRSIGGFLEEITSLDQHYALRYKLGSGYTSTVYAAWDTWSGDEVAVKVVPRERQQLVANEDYYQEVYTAVMQLHHDNLIPVSRFMAERNNYFIVMERCLGTDLVDFVLKRDPAQIPRAFCKRLMRQILSGIHCLHKNDMLHRDMKLDNLMFLDSANTKLVLIDFDMCKFTHRKDEPKKSSRRNEVSVVGTREYMAPECYDGIYSTASDIWSCGVILFILLDGHFPFDVAGCATHKDICRSLREGIRSNTQLPKTDPEAFNLVQKMLSFRRENRIQTAAEALCHPWLKSHDESTTFPECKHLIRSNKPSLKECSTPFFLPNELLSTALVPSSSTSPNTTPAAMQTKNNHTFLNWDTNFLDCLSSSPNSTCASRNFGGAPPSFEMSPPNKLVHLRQEKSLTSDRDASRSSFARQKFPALKTPKFDIS